MKTPSFEWKTQHTCNFAFGNNCKATVKSSLTFGRCTCQCAERVPRYFKPRLVATRPNHTPMASTLERTSRSVHAQVFSRQPNTFPPTNSQQTTQWIKPNVLSSLCRLQPRTHAHSNSSSVSTTPRKHPELCCRPHVLLLSHETSNHLHEPQLSTPSTLLAISLEKVLTSSAQSSSKITLLCLGN